MNLENPGPREVEPEPAVPPEHRDDRPALLEGRETTEGSPFGRGFKDRECRDFRAMYEDEYHEPMTRSTPVEKFADPRETVQRINPDYDKGREYQQNCADCARCFERTWRGNREEAAGRAETPDADGNLAVRGEDFTRTERWAGETFTRTEDVAAIRTALEQGGHGSSAIIGSSWENGRARGGHAYNLVNHQGRILVVDAQDGQVMEFDDKTVHPGFAKSYGHRVMMWDRNGERIF